MPTRPTFGVATLLLLTVCPPAMGALFDRGDGTIADDLQGIAWLEDINHVKSLCDADDPVWQDFAIAAGRKTTICDTNNGAMRWPEAQSWIAHLNAESYLGYNDWRLWQTNQPDPSCSVFTDDGVDNDFGVGCLGSELGHLWNLTPPDGLGNPSFALDVGNGTCGIGLCFLNQGPFVGSLTFTLWSNTPYAPDPAQAWRFVQGLGSSQPGATATDHHVWPVRPLGAPSPIEVPTLGTISLIALALLLALLALRRV